MSVVPSSSHLRFVTRPEGGAFVLDVRQGRCYTINQLGHDIWREFGAGKTESAILDELTQRFPNVERQQLEADIKSFGDGLRRNKLL